MSKACILPTIIYVGFVKKLLKDWYFTLYTYICLPVSMYM